MRIKAYTTAQQGNLELTLYHMGNYHSDAVWKRIARFLLKRTQVASQYRASTRIGAPYGTAVLKIDYAIGKTPKEIKAGHAFLPIRISNPIEIAAILLDGIDLCLTLSDEVKDEITREKLELLVADTVLKLFPEFTTNEEIATLK